MSDTIPPTLNSLELVYSSESLSAQTERYKNLAAKFEAEYNCKPDFFARAPGRVNLIGEHIDYSGYGVLPMAISQDIVIAAAVVKDSFVSKCRVANVKSSHASFEFDPNNIVIDTAKHHWGNYVLAGFKGAADAISGTHAPLYLMVDGIIPSGAGLSSSSALVCCVALAVANAYSHLFTKVQFADLCAKCERLIGTEGGGMDQSISFMAEKGTAKNIMFHPLRATQVNLPEGAAFVVADSSVVSEKQVTAATHFNLRVVECRMSALLLAKKEGAKNWKECRTMSKAQTALELSVEQLKEKVEKHLHPGSYSLDELSTEFGMTETEIIEELMSPSTAGQKSFKLHDRARHVLTETLRVDAFRSTCESATSSEAALTELGKLMNESHASCKDDYECSCEELDELTSICRSLGAFGSRLTGAGWGGCCVSLVKAVDVDKFLEQLKVKYFERRNISNGIVFASSPGGGAAILENTVV